jgi:hypothetical protein
MSKEIETVKCPWCHQPFKVVVDTKYSGAEAIPDEIPGHEGENQTCPNNKCGHVLFIHWYLNQRDALIR